MDEMLLGATKAPQSFGSLFQPVTTFLNGFVDSHSYGTSTFPWQGETVLRLQGFLEPILPAIFAILAVTIALKLAIKAFKKFSR